MAVKFHLCLLLITLVGMGAFVASQGKHSIYSVFSKVLHIFVRNAVKGKVVNYPGHLIFCTFLAE